VGVRSSFGRCAIAVLTVSTLCMPLRGAAALPPLPPLTLDYCAFAVLGSIYHGGIAMMDVHFVNHAPKAITLVTVETQYDRSPEAPMLRWRTVCV
jgi:hypothetical protein